MLSVAFDVDQSVVCHYPISWSRVLVYDNFEAFLDSAPKGVFALTQGFPNLVFHTDGIHKVTRVE